MWAHWRERGGGVRNHPHPRDCHAAISSYNLLSGFQAQMHTCPECFSSCVVWDSNHIVGHVGSSALTNMPPVGLGTTFFKEVVEQRVQNKMTFKKLY